MISRLPIFTRDGYDCVDDNPRCPVCVDRRKHGMGPPERDHGIFGGDAQYAVTTTHGARRAVLALAVLLTDYPSSALARFEREGKRLPTSLRRNLASAMSLHIQVPWSHDDVKPPPGQMCTWIPQSEGGRCEIVLLDTIGAHTFYNRFGAERGVAQQESFWLAFERRLLDELVRVPIEAVH